MIRRAVFLGPLVCAALACAAPAARDVGDRGETALRQALLDLENDLTVMAIAAHPDDEDGPTLAYLRHRHGVKTVLVLVTRGEGGQNQIGPELYEHLAVIRSEETRRACAILGADLRMLNCRDFGYSKSPDEALAHWNAEPYPDKPVDRLVKLIREHRPHVIVTNHDPAGKDHGHHVAAARLAVRAFDRADDDAHRPDLGAPWRVLRLCTRVTDRSPRKAAIEFDTGALDRLRGESYAETAARALHQHRSQGMGRWARFGKGPRPKRYAVLKSRLPERDSERTLFAGIPAHPPPPLADERLRHTYNQATRRVALGPGGRPALVGQLVRMGENIDAILRDLDARARTKKLGERLRDFRHALTGRRARVARALWLALDLYLETDVTDARQTRTQRTAGEVRLYNGGARPVQAEFGFVVSGAADRIATDKPRLIAPGGTETFAAAIPWAPTDPWSVPRAARQYHTDLPRRHPVRAFARVRVGEFPFEHVQAVDLELVPSVELNIDRERIVLPVSGRERSAEFKITVTSNVPGAHAANLRVLVNGERLGDDLKLTFAREQQQHVVTFRLPVPADFTGDRTISVTATSGTDTVSAEATARVIDVKVAPGLKVGLVRSYDDTLERTLAALGVDTTLLGADALRAGDLSRFDTILTDIRAYRERKDLRANNARLLAYVRGGGHLVVTYNKTFEWNPPANPAFAPYPLTLSRDRITREDAKLTILTPAHPLFTRPNRITQADFDGWVQERGLYFPGTYDKKRYVEMLAGADPGETPLRGGQLFAAYGKGSYVYTAYVWYRQLKAGVPGGWRCFANLISYPKRK